MRKTAQVRAPGGSKSVIAKYVDTLFDETWREMRITADLHVRLQPPKGTEVYAGYTRGDSLTATASAS